jgi:hypothetical protein
VVSHEKIHHQGIGDHEGIVVDVADMKHHHGYPEQIK